MDMISYHSLIPFLLITAFAYGSLHFKKLDFFGAVCGWLIAVSVFLGGGYTHLSLLLLFFVFGVTASKWKQHEKEALSLEQENQGVRSWGNALGNGGVAGICGLLYYAIPSSHTMLLLALAGSLAAATADTLSSELGNVYGKKYIDILSWKAGRRGDNGVVSLEGTLLGSMGALVIGVAALEHPTFPVFIGGVAGTLADSLLGATLERRQLLNNDWVNFLSTAIGAVVSCLTFLLL